MTEIGHGTQVVKILDDHSYQLDENLLKAVLLNEEIKDLPVVVVSVAGAYRGGKSFLLNFFLRYLTSPESARQDGSWLGEDSEPLVGFDWRGGVKRNTTGILLWSKPFIVTLFSGEKVAVLLMDTQGTFDSKSTVRDNSTIFALSTLISSVQIYNLSTNIQEDDMQHLQLFTMYGKMIQEQDYSGKAFQILEFLVRDWPYPYDYPFGAVGGYHLLQERLEMSPEQPNELRELRNHIRSCFEQVLCFLMPHPGFKVLDPNCKGNISDIDPDFRIHLMELVSSLLSSEKLCPKIISGQKVKAKELFNYFKSYMAIFNSDCIPNPVSIMEATVQASLLSSMNEARDVFEKGMDSECGPTQLSVPTGEVQELHHKYLAKAQTAFLYKKTMATQKEVNKYLDKLNKELEDRLPQFEQSNLSKLQATVKKANAVYEEMIDNLNVKDKHQPLCLHPQDLKTGHQNGVEAALKLYDAQVKKITEKPDQTRIELIQSFENQYMQLKMSNEKNNKDAINNLVSEYWKIMESKSLDPPISDEDYKRGHETAHNQVLVEFQLKRNLPDSYPNDIYKEELVKTITDTFWRLQAINHRKIEQEAIRKEQEAQRIEQEKVKIEQIKDYAEQQRLAKVQEINQLMNDKARIEQERRKMEIENERLRRQQRSSGSDCILL